MNKISIDNFEDVIEDPEKENLVRSSNWEFSFEILYPNKDTIYLYFSSALIAGLLMPILFSKIPILTSVSLIIGLAISSFRTPHYIITQEKISKIYYYPIISRLFEITCIEIDINEINSVETTLNSKKIVPEKDLDRPIYIRNNKLKNDIDRIIVSRDI